MNYCRCRQARHDILLFTNCVIAAPDQKLAKTENVEPQAKPRAFVSKPVEQRIRCQSCLLLPAPLEHFHLFFNYWTPITLSSWVPRPRYFLTKCTFSSQRLQALKRLKRRTPKRSSISLTSLRACPLGKMFHYRQLEDPRISLHKP